MRQQAVDASDSDVIDVLNVIAHQFCGDDRFFGDWDVARSRRHDHDHALAVSLAITLEHDGASQGTILRSMLGQVYSGGDGRTLFLVGPPRQIVAAVSGPAVECFTLVSLR